MILKYNLFLLVTIVLIFNFNDCYGFNIDGDEIDCTYHRDLSSSDKGSSSFNDFGCIYKARGKDIKTSAQIFNNLLKNKKIIPVIIDRNGGLQPIEYSKYFGLKGIGLPKEIGGFWNNWAIQNANPRPYEFRIMHSSVGNNGTRFFGFYVPERKTIWWKKIDHNNERLIDPTAEDIKEINERYLR